MLQLFIWTSGAKEFLLVDIQRRKDEASTHCRVLPLSVLKHHSCGGVSKGFLGLGKVLFTLKSRQKESEYACQDGGRGPLRFLAILKTSIVLSLNVLPYLFWMALAPHRSSSLAHTIRGVLEPEESGNDLQHSFPFPDRRALLSLLLFHLLFSVSRSLTHAPTGPAESILLGLK